MIAGRSSGQKGGFARLRLRCHESQASYGMHSKRRRQKSRRLPLERGSTGLVGQTATGRTGRQLACQLPPRPALSSRASCGLRRKPAAGKRLHGKFSDTGNGAWRMRRGRGRALRETNIDALRTVDSCKCPSMEGQVKIPSGYRNIEDIRAGDEVLSYNECTKRLEVQTVAQTIIRKTDRIYTLVYDTGTKLQTTATHPFYIEGKGWVKAADLHVGDDSLLSTTLTQGLLPAFCLRRFSLEDLTNSVSEALRILLMSSRISYSLTSLELSSSNQG